MKSRTLFNNNNNDNDNNDLISLYDAGSTRKTSWVLYTMFFLLMSHTCCTRAAAAVERCLDCLRFWTSCAFVSPRICVAAAINVTITVTANIRAEVKVEVKVKVKVKVKIEPFPRRLCRVGSDPARTPDYEALPSTHNVNPQALSLHVTTLLANIVTFAMDVSAFSHIGRRYTL